MDFAIAQPILPSYQPLRQRMHDLAPGTISEVVLEETRQEMALFEAFSDFYGYTFYALSPAASR